MNVVQQRAGYKILTATELRSYGPTEPARLAL